MKTIIFYGSPRKNGHTRSLVDELILGLSGDYYLVNAYEKNISPCIDCRYCWKNKGCFIQDDMQEVYEYLQDCDNVLIASPIQFGEMTGPLLSVLSRFQTYDCAKRFRKEIPIEKPKKGGVIIVGGNNGNKEIPFRTAGHILRTINARDIKPLVSSMFTDDIPAIKDEVAIEELHNLIREFNSQ